MVHAGSSFFLKFMTNNKFLVQCHSGCILSIKHTGLKISKNVNLLDINLNLIFEQNSLTLLMIEDNEGLFLKCGFRKKSFIMNPPLVSWAYLSSLLGGCNSKPTPKWWQICSTDYRGIHNKWLLKYEIHTLVIICVLTNRDYICSYQLSIVIYTTHLYKYWILYLYCWI